MIETAIKVIDRLIQLLKERQLLETVKKADMRQLAMDIVDPLYRDIEDVYKDYVEILFELQDQVGDPSSNLENIIGQLTQRRMTFQPLRDKVRAFAKEMHRVFKEKPSDKEARITDALVTFANRTKLLMEPVPYEHSEYLQEYFDANRFPVISRRTAGLLSLTSGILRALEHLQLDVNYEEDWRIAATEYVGVTLHMQEWRWQLLVSAYAELRMMLLCSWYPRIEKRN